MWPVKGRSVTVRMSEIAGLADVLAREVIRRNLAEPAPAERPPLRRGDRHPGQPHREPEPGPALPFTDDEFNEFDQS
jgi:hypothetical protein